MGRINNTFGYNEKRTRRYGKFFNSIEFEIDDTLSEEKYGDPNVKPVVGKFYIGNQSFPVTYTELSHIIDTLEDAQRALNNKYRLGLMRR
jgi:hypothetical protein